ncbi:MULTISPECIES: sulfite exporter TauE/SafE family protein [Marinobacter]|uniref:sulfite exporter TauE/SafE family protein n=1 Tax=Marinobacter TaxID=2742 RepID=UPI00112F9D7C|nr:MULTISPECIES: sulfite exporter TauE/SafE family protein [Marinobacter]MEC7433156.1 sulfite exporter TauE/SafE family protein [Pseudomonadota bacterium]MBY6221904.1 sulfite exporter TauE/SafE family protein [Marinobacter nauticus]MEC8898275.1 sulfite exporter TauE/SafE family protein [Pseudomonadota bacterium]MEC9041565.1 sulfite exporter TauE/SafE family protein [Pseudomonadota bacterium]MEC9084811.1 sulfite exporter TauE/SafE family protein [Pseudomonadota bacterium]
MSLIVFPEALSTSVIVFLLMASAVTSMITATLGAGGGVLLLVLMASWLPPAAIIPVHGMIQLGSNSGRAILTWHHIDWKVIAAFAPGVLAGAGLGAWLLVDLPAHLWQLSIALFVLYLCWGPGLPKASFGPFGVFIASAITSFVSLFVGATGPLVAAFIKQIHTDRFRTVATFGTAMTLQHAPKALVFGVAGFVFSEWLLFILAMIACGFAGTWLGLHLLKSINNRWFHTAFNLVLTLLAFRLLWQAARSAGWLG